MQQQAQMIPYNVQRSATRHRLGSPQAIYAARKESWLHLLPGIIALLIGGAVLAYFLHAYASFFIFWPFWQMALVPIIGAGWSLVGLWILFSPLFSPKIRIFVYTEGLVYATRTCEVIRWGQMERLWKDIRLDRKKRKISSYIMRRNDQAFFVFKPNLLDGEKLGMLLEEEITRHLLPRAIVAFDAGDPILFDTIAISPGSIRVKQGRKKLAWSELERLHLDDQALEIYKKGQPAPWASLKIVDIPNVEILRGLVRYVQQELEYRQVPSIAAYRAGLSVAFGPLKISPRGVVINASTLPWNEIAGIGVGESEVMIKRKGNPASWNVFPLWRIPDVSSLKELINYIMRNAI